LLSEEVFNERFLLQPTWSNIEFSAELLPRSTRRHFSIDSDCLKLDYVWLLKGEWLFNINYSYFIYRESVLEEESFKKRLTCIAAGTLLLIRNVNHSASIRPQTRRQCQVFSYQRSQHIYKLYTHTCHHLISTNIYSLNIVVLFFTLFFLSLPVYYRFNRICSTMNCMTILMDNSNQNFAESCNILWNIPWKSRR